MIAETLHNLNIWIRMVRLVPQPFEDSRPRPEHQN
jgi:hypothetical protein